MGKKDIQENNAPMEIVSKEDNTLKKIEDTSLSKTDINSRTIPAFEPTKKMKLWLQYELEHPELSNKAVAQAAKISEMSFYTWLHDQRFIDWRKAEWDKRLKMHGATLDKIGLRRAGEEYKYWRAMQARIGNLSDGNNNPTVTNIAMNMEFFKDGE
jgi:hypothetical protein